MPSGKRIVLRIASPRLALADGAGQPIRQHGAVDLDGARRLHLVPARFGFLQKSLDRVQLVLEVEVFLLSHAKNTGLDSLIQRDQVPNQRHLTSFQPHGFRCLAAQFPLKQHPDVLLHHQMFLQGLHFRRGGRARINRSLVVGVLVNLDRCGFVRIAHPAINLAIMVGHLRKEPAGIFRHRQAGIILRIPEHAPRGFIVETVERFFRYHPVNEIKLLSAFIGARGQIHRIDKNRLGNVTSNPSVAWILSRENDLAVNA